MLSSRFIQYAISGIRQALFRQSLPFIFCGFCFLGGHLQAQQPAYFSFRHILQDQVSGIGYINSIKQDKTGFMWFGGANGLARYDGYELTIYRHNEKDPNSLSHSYINNILVADNGDLWLATRMGLNYYNAKTQQFIRWPVKSPFNPELESIDLLSVAYKDKNHLWLGTRDGLMEFSISTKQMTYQDLPLLNKSLNRMIWSITTDDSGYIWLGTQSAGAIRLRPDTMETTQYNRYLDLSFVDVRRVYRDRQNIIWAATYDAGLFRFNAALNQFEKIIHAKNEKSATVWSVLEDSRGNLWVGDGSAVYHRPSDGKHFSRFVYSEQDSRSPGNYVVNELFEDNAGGIWLGYFPSGVDVIDRQASVFRNYRHDVSNTNSLTDGGVLSSARDEKDNLWIGTGYGLNYFDKKLDKFTRYEFDENKPDWMSGNTILSMALDGENLWLGIWSGGVNKLHIPSGKFTRYLPDVQNPNSLKGREAWSVICDSKGFIWIATEEGLNRFDPRTDEFRLYLPPSSQMDGEKVLYSRVVYEDKQGQIWLGTSRGLYKVDAESGSFIRYQHNPEDPKSLKVDYIFSIFEDSRGNFWLGTDGGGLQAMDRNTGEFQSYTTADGLSDDVVMGILEDKSGYLWLGTQKGISRFDSNNKTFRNFDKRHGLSDNLFNRNSPLLLESGDIFFGNSKGFVLFNPFSIETNPYISPVVFTNLQVFNKPVLPSEESLLKNSITHSAALNLSYKEMVFTLEFAALNYQMPEENRYMYRLTGFDKDWINAGNRHSVTYTNLDSGSYLFEVKASNNDGVWNPEPAKLQIIIAPAWWNTIWAYALYLIAILLFIFWIWRTLQMRLYFERRRVEQERSLVRRLQEIDKLKDEFLANTSHELRTPLNGIIGLAESLRDGVEGEVPESMRHSLGLIATSGKRLSSLVDDILDFAKLKNKGLSLHKKVVDLSVLVDVVISLIRPLLGDKKIILENLITKDFPGVIADEDRLLQILYNLIGNAVKFTDQGFIRVYARLADNNMAVYVQDSGMGIPENKLNEIFEAFQQIDGNLERHQGGTGLGLTITKQLVELHGGILSVESIAGEGSTFCFTLPHSKDLPRPDNVHSQQFIRNVANLIQVERHALMQNSDVLDDSAKEGAHILVVDDDALNRKVLTNYLSFRDYRVSEAGSGEEAIAIIEQSQDVDLVLLDIMMPRLSGYETCKRLRMAYPTHELPIIFLTARNQTNDLVMGFDVGGNDFLTKPIEKEELLARVATHLQLLDATRHLDKKVAERTQELNKTNEGLRLAQQRLHDAYLKIEEASLTDPLTGLHNRRFLTKSIVSDIALVDRAYQDLLQSPASVQPIPDQDLSFLILDIDFFKDINDSYGHAAGDRLLEQFSRLLEKNLRDSDYVIRWGGEEFLIVLRMCSRSEVSDMVERIRRSIDEYEFDLGNGKFARRSCSIGYATYPFYCHAPEALSWEQVVDTADRALYIAKRSGRNCWVGISSSGDLHQTPVNPAIQTNLPVLFALNQLQITSSLGRELLVVDARTH